MSKLNLYLTRTALIVLILAGLVWIFNKVEIDLGALASKTKCAEKIFDKVKPDTKLREIEGGRWTISTIGLDQLTNMSPAEFSDFQLKSPDMTLDKLIKFPVESRDQHIQNIKNSPLCDRQLIKFK